MIEIAEAQAFLAILEAGSLRRAALARGVDATTLGRLIARVEARMGVSLLHRTTRALHPTPAGELFAEHARALLEQARTLEETVTALGRSPRGRLRLNLCSGYARARLLPLLSKWVASQQGLELDLRLDDNPVNLVNAGVDIAVRVVPAAGDDVIATKLETYAHVVVASPKWVARHGELETPVELASRPTIAMETDRAWSLWPFRRAGESVAVRARPVAWVNDADALVSLAEAGVGATVLPTYLAEGPIHAGRLVRLLRPWTLPSGAAHALHARRRRLSAAARACLSMLEASLASARAG
ncbi:MAG: LysR family transcriptional regulator [Polyangiaceae bacterium]